LSSPPNLGIPEFTSNEIQKLWFSTQKKEWSSLAIVPAAPGLSIVPLAKALARTGEAYLERTVRLILAEGTDLNSASRIIIEMSSQLSYGNCAIVALDSIIQNAAGIPIVLAADACLLCVQLKQTSFSQANRTVEMVGASRFVGVVTLPLPGKRPTQAQVASKGPFPAQAQKPSNVPPSKSLSIPPQKFPNTSIHKPLNAPPPKPPGSSPKKPD